VNPEMSGELVDGETISVGLNEFFGLFATQSSRGFLAPDLSNIRTWLRILDPFAQVSELIQGRGMVRVSPDKLH